MLAVCKLQTGLPRNQGLFSSRDTQFSRGIHFSSGPTQPPIQSTWKMMKGFESSSRHVSQCSWFVCGMSVCVMKRGSLGARQKQNISHQAHCPQATHKYSCIKRTCLLCQVSLTYLFCLLAVLTNFL